jgi:hypothetical protein
MLGQKPDSALGISKGHEIFAQDSHADWRAVGLGNFLR